MNAKVIFLPKYWFLPLNGLIGMDGFKIEFSEEYPGDESVCANGNGVAIKGVFFYLHTLLPACQGSPINRFEILSLIKTRLEISFQESMPLDNLVIHMRGGDIFSSNIHPSYGQPPFAFYQYIISVYKYKIVHLVCEDLLNPTIPLIKNYCDLNGIDFSLISGNLRSDIEFLLRAQNLVVGRGSFSSAITSLSHNLKNVYFFESGYSTWGNNNLNVIKIRDLDGEYKERVLTSNWTNSIEQVNLMLDYPISKVG